MSRRIAIGFAIGFAIGVSDVVIFRLLDVRMLWQGTDVTIPVVIFFAFSFGLFGAAIGRVWDQREVIRTQFSDLRDARRQLVEQETLAAVGRLASGVAHEVRNPLGVIRSSASLLGEDLERSSDEAKAADFIVEEVDRLDAFVRRLLDFTRPLQLEIESTSTGEILRRATRIEHEVVVEVDDPSIPFEADAGLLAQALRNLVTNAAQAGERVCVRVGREGENVVWRVADDGPGLRDHERVLVFEPFHTTRTSGTGLGLAMTRKIARLHRGDVRYVHGEGLGPEGRGATFEIEHPASLSEE